MDLRNLEENKEQILRKFLEERNAWDLKRIRCEINWLLSKADSNSWADLEDAYRERISERHYSLASRFLRQDEFSLLERAVMILLLYTGMRSCDVAAIRLHDIDWEAETINIVQQKTAEPLAVAMLPAVGNAVFEYLRGGFPASFSEYLFGEEDSREGHISAKNIRIIAYKAMLHCSLC